MTEIHAFDPDGTPSPGAEAGVSTIMATTLDPQVASIVASNTATRTALDTAMVDRFGPSISPYSFGAVGDGVTDDSDAWQAFLDHCSATDVGTAQVAGTFALSKGLIYQPIGAATEVKTLLFSGKTTFVGTSGSGGEYMLKVVNAPQLKWEHLKMRGTGISTSWASRGWRVGLWLDKVARASFGALVADYFAFAGVWAGHNNNSLNDYGASRFSFCGSGERTWTDGRATTTWSSEVQSGAGTSVAQKSTIMVDTLPPAYVMDNTFEQSALMLRITLTTGETRLFHVDSIDQLSKTVSVTPWIGNGDATVAADWVFGGGMVLNGDDSNVVTFTGLDARYCGIGLNCGSLYVPVAPRVVAQFCGTAITLGRRPTGAILGGELTGIYVEGNTEDIVWVSRPGTSSVYTVLDSEYALNLKKCYVVGALRDADGTENGLFSDFGGRFTYRGRSYQPLKGTRNTAYTSSTRVIAINRPEQYDTQFSNGRTIRYSLDVDVHRLTGYDAARLLVVGTGANSAPSGAITFAIPDGVTPTGVPWTLNGGTTSVAFTGFDAATEFLVRFDFASGDCTVVRLTPRMSATTAELESASNQINTTNKTSGRTVYNSDTRKTVTASGAAASSAWHDSAGVVAHTPA